MIPEDEIPDKKTNHLMNHTATHLMQQRTTHTHTRTTMHVGMCGFLCSCQG